MCVVPKDAALVAWVPAAFRGASRKSWTRWKEAVVYEGAAIRPSVWSVPIWSCSSRSARPPPSGAGLLRRMRIDIECSVSDG
jgi:hypothetical protein